MSSNTLSPTNIDAIRAATPALAGQWHCQQMLDREGSAWAVISRSGGWRPGQEDFLIRRHGTKLRLQVTRRPFGPVLVAACNDVDTLCLALGKAVREGKADARTWLPEDNAV